MQIPWIDVGHELQESLAIKPVDVESEVALHVEQVLQRLFGGIVVGNKAVPASLPLNILPMFSLPVREDINRVGT